MFTLLAPLQSMRNVAEAKREEATYKATVEETGHTVSSILKKCIFMKYTYVHGWDEKKILWQKYKKIFLSKKFPSADQTSTIQELCGPGSAPFFVSVLKLRAWINAAFEHH